MRGLSLAAGRRSAGLAAMAMAVVMATTGAASAQQLSEKAVRTFMDYAWSLTPKKFTKPDGSSILIDRSKRSEVEVPLDNARNVILAGRMTAHAQICELEKHQIANYQSMMRRERRSQRWSEQQMVFINQLHLTTVMLLTGQIGVKSTDKGEKDLKVNPKKATPAATCTEEQRKRVAKLVEDYVKAEPKYEKKQAKKKSG